MTGVILVTCEYPPFAGGIATYAAQLSAAVRSAGHAVRIIAPRYENSERADVEDCVRLFRHHSVPLGAALQALRQLRRWPKADILLAADIRSVLLAYANKLLSGRPYRAAIHGSEIGKFGGSSPMKPLVRRAYLGAEAVIANSQATLDLFEAAFGAPPRGQVTHLGLDPYWLGTAGSTFENAALAALPADATVVSTVGRIEPRKGHREAIRVIAKAQAVLGRRLLYIIAGRAEDDAYLTAVLAEAQTLGVETMAVGRLSQADLRRLYARSACHLLIAQPVPGKIEGFGLVLIEAGAQGCPSVTTRVGGIPEVLGEQGGAAEDYDDVEGLGAALAHLISAPSDRDRVRANALRFSWDACVAKTFPELFLQSGRGPD